MLILNILFLSYENFQNGPRSLTMQFISFDVHIICVYKNDENHVITIKKKTHSYLNFTIVLRQIQNDTTANANIYFTNSLFRLRPRNAEQTNFTFDFEPSKDYHKACFCFCEALQSA